MKQKNTALAIMTSMALFATANCLAHSTEMQLQGNADHKDVQTLINYVAMPQLEDPKTGKLHTDNRIGRLKNRGKTQYSTQCLVDFTDPQALAMTEPSLWFDRILVPWFQLCSGLTYIDIRPTYYNHLHLGFQDEHVLPCPSNDMAYPSHIENNECDFVDIPIEPRTHVTTHDSGEHVLVRLYDSAKFIPFNFHQIKVVGSNSMQLCFKRAFSNDDPWIAQSPSQGATGGPWICWRELLSGTYNMESWVHDVIAVRLSPTNGTGSFSFDDIVVSFSN